MGSNCKQAALRAYRDLRASGDNEAAAFETAVTIYRFHHPETPVIDSFDLVDGWIEASVAEHA